MTERLNCCLSYDCEWCNGNESLDLLHIYPCPLLILSFPGGSSGKESACNVGVLVLKPGLGRSPGEGNGNPLQDSCLENLMDRGAWWAIVHVTRVEHNLGTKPPL